MFFESQQSVDLSENILQNLFDKLPPRLYLGVDMESKWWIWYRSGYYFNSEKIVALAQRV